MDIDVLFLRASDLGVQDGVDDLVLAVSVLAQLLAIPQQPGQDGIGVFGLAVVQLIQLRLQLAPDLIEIALHLPQGKQMVLLKFQLLLQVSLVDLLIHLTLGALEDAVDQIERQQLHDEQERAEQRDVPAGIVQMQKDAQCQQLQEDERGHLMIIPQKAEYITQRFSHARPHPALRRIPSAACA